MPHVAVSNVGPFFILGASRRARGGSCLTTRPPARAVDFRGDCPMVAACESRILMRLSDAHHPEFLRLLPMIRRQASMAFRNERRDVREELVQEVVANAFQAFV